MSWSPVQFLLNKCWTRRVQVTETGSQTTEAEMEWAITDVGSGFAILASNHVLAVRSNTFMCLGPEEWSNLL